MGVLAPAGMSPASASAAGRSEASGSVSGGGAPAPAAEGVPADHTKGAPARGTTPAAASKLKTIVIEYDGYSITVPSSWQVFHLDTDPSQCVRYDINAVYLGNPGANQNCPSNLIGRAQTITITDAGVSGTPPALYQRAATAHGGLGAGLPAGSARSRVGSVPSTLSWLDQYGQQHEFQGSVARSDVSVTGTYAGDPAQVEDIIRGMRKLWAQPSGTGAPGAASGSPLAGTGAPGAASGSPLAGGGDARKATAIADAPFRTLPIKAGGALKPAATSTSTAAPASAPEPTTSATPPSAPEPTASASATPTSTPTPAPAATPSSTLTASLKPYVPRAPLEGFDTCTAPSLNAMKAWKAKYSAIGVYIGGMNMACDYGNLSASWVKSTHWMGWNLLPLYVGLQAPCNKFPAKINPSTADGQAKGAANAAVADAANFGLRKGTPIYFDMESYNNSNTNCRHAVLTFLDAWTRELHARGYASGVYSSASSGVTDLVSTTTLNGHSFAEPDALWFALWDKNDSLTGTPFLPSGRWPSDRVKQYAGNRTKKIGGYTLNIDADRIGGAVSGPGNP